jgi:orotate phosphoribosyltransferase-like protein
LSSPVNKVGRDAKVKWAVAGRSKSRIECILKSIATKLENDKVLEVDTLVVDTS